MIPVSPVVVGLGLALGANIASWALSSELYPELVLFAEKPTDLQYKLAAALFGAAVLLAGLGVGKVCGPVGRGYFWLFGGPPLVFSSLWWADVLNVRLDRSPTETREITVDEKRHEPAEGRHLLFLAHPSGPPYVLQVDVTAEEFARMEPGRSRLRLRMRAGALKAPYGTGYELVP